MFISFINNLSLLLALSICHSLVLQRWKPETLSYKIITGLLFGGVAVAGMMNPFKFTEGIIFDGRSLVASIAGLFGGPVTAAIVVLIAGYYRIFIIGGGGALMGICVLTSSSGIGVLYHYWKVKNPGAIRPRHLYSLGILVHLCMVLCMFALPSASVWNAIRTLSLPVMILFPIGTVLLGKLLLSQEKNLQTYLALQVSEEKYRDLVENANSVILRVDANGIITFFNEFAQKFFGYTESEIIGKPIVGTIIPEVDSAGKELRHIIRDIFNDPIKYTKNENENICKNGKRVLISWMNKVFIDKTGVPFEMLCIGSDITDQKQAEKALYDSERRYRALVENMPGTVYYTEPAPPWKILYISDEIFNLCGYHAQDFLGNNTCYFDDLIHPDDREKYDRLINQGISNHEPYDIEYRIFHKDKSIRWVHEKGKSIYDENQQPLRLNGVIIDSTEQKRMEEELQKMRKLESVGILAGGIAHDFNNLLTAILGNISVAKSQPLSMDAILTRLGEAEKASLRAQELTRQLLTFSKGGAPVKQTADIKDIVRETALFALRGTNARCDFDFSEDLWLTSLDQGQFSQVIQNLVINAHQAMPHGGKIYIQAENVSIKEKDEILFPGLMEGRYLKLSITDEGIGIPEKDLATIFDPYYTTKPDGSGLGLATTYSIIKKHDGAITVQSHIGIGTVFVIYLPAVIVAAPEQTVMDDEIIQGHGCILVMDDDEMVREIASIMLEELGYQVVLAEDGEETIKLYKQLHVSEHPLTAVVMDLTIPGGIGGKETIASLLQIDPDIKAIVSSGYSDDPIMANYRDYGFSGVIKKPYRINELGSVLHQILA